jgi:hypothetical protein
VAAFAGRGTVFGQGNLMSNGRIQPFVLGGFGFGESGGPMFGGGLGFVRRTVALACG